MLPFTSLLFRVIVPWFTMPPPLVWLAVLLSISLVLRVALPPFAMPPAPAAGSAGGRVAVDLGLDHQDAGPGSAWPPLPLAMPPPFGEVLPLTWLLLRVAEPSRFWIPAARVGGGVAVHLAEGQDGGAHRPGAEVPEAMPPPALDPPARGALPVTWL